MPQFFFKPVFLRFSFFHFPLTSARHFTYVCFENFLPTWLGPAISVNFKQESHVLRLSVAENRISFIIYTTHFRFVYIPKSHFLPKSCALWWCTVKKTKTLLLYFLNGYRYLKNFNSFNFQVQRAINSGTFIKELWKISSHCEK